MSSSQIDIPHIPSVVVDDEDEDLQRILEKLDSAKIFDSRSFASYRGEAVAVAAANAQLVSLDWYVENETWRGLGFAKALLKQDPSKTIIVFTSQPTAVSDFEGHFVLEKTESVWANYETICSRIWFHDRCLSLVRWLDEQLVDERHGVHASTETQWEPWSDFYPRIFQVAELVRMPNTAAYRRYHSVSDLLLGMREGKAEAAAGRAVLQRARKRAMESLLEEYAELSRTEGVLPTKVLRCQLETLSETVLGVSDLEAVLNRAFGRSLVTGLGSWLSTAMNGLVEMQVPEAQEETGTLRVRAWFGSEEAPTTPVIGQWCPFQIELSVMGTPVDSTDGDVEPSFGVDSLDLLLLCALADVRPLKSRIELPFEDVATVDFSVRPRAACSTELVLIVEVFNEPIHRISFPFAAIEVEPITGDVEGEP